MALYNNVDDFIKRRAAILEMQAGIKAAKDLQGKLRSLIGVETIKRTGAMLRTNAKAIADKSNGQLDRITIKSPRYAFMLNYGFEGIKSNGVAMHLKATKHLHDAIEQTNIINQLANEIGAIRADEVVASINF